MSERRLSRRQFLHRGGLVGVGVAALLAGCQPKIVEVTKVVEKQVEKVVKETVVQVEKQVVKETVVVEQAAPTAAPAKFDLIHWTIYHLMADDPTGVYTEYRNTATERFKAMYPNVTVKWENHGWANDLRQNLVAALLAGTGPDVICGENDFQEYADVNALIPLDDTIRDIQSNLIPATYAASVTKGKVYGINQMTGLFAFARNSKIQEQAGLDPNSSPKTWDDLLEQGMKAVKAGNGKFHGYAMMGTKGWLIAGIFQCAVYLSQLDASLCKEDCTYPWFNDPKAEKFWTFCRELQKTTPPGMTFSPDQGIVYNAIWQDKVAFACDGSWNTRTMLKPENQHIRFAPFPIPQGGHDSSVVVASVMNGVLTGSKHKEESAAYCKMWTEDIFQELIFSLDRLPSTRSSITKVMPKASPDEQVLLKVLLDANPAILPQFRKEPDKVWKVCNDFLYEQVLTSTTPIKDLMDKAQADADAILKAVS